MDLWRREEPNAGRGQGRSSEARRAGAFAVLSLVIAACGCAQPGPFAQRSALVGSLRESVSQLEADKQQLERQVANLSSENRRLEDRLVQEEAYTEELAQRLEAGRRFVGRSNEGEGLDRGQDAPRTIPSRGNPRRRVPMAQIPGEIHPAPEAGEDAQGGSSRSRATRSTPPEDEPDDFDLFSSADARGARSRSATGGSPWLPIAQGRDASVDRR
jgi:hypothetical protein